VSEQNSTSLFKATHKQVPVPFFLPFFYISKISALEQPVLQSVAFF
jgi:hypothetical protein